MNEYQIRRATPKHCKSIIAIAKEGQLFNYTFLLYATLIALGWAYVVLDRKGKVVGYSCYALIPFSKKAFSIQSAFTKECRGKGFGTKLLGFICKEVQRIHRTDTIYAHILKPRVLKLINKLGWKSIASVLGIFLVKKKIR
jgi:GNAT superfamily N-acetyltransferase